MNPKPKSQSL